MAQTLTPPTDMLSRLREAGLRLTPATHAVLTMFATDPTWAPTHAEVLEALQRQGITVNRVTLYRLLDRLAGCGVLERHTDGAERAWRFTPAAPSPTDHGMATRFECDACYRQFRLSQATEATQAAADALLQALADMGHKAQRVDLAIHGTCAGCDPGAHVGE